MKIKFLNKEHEAFYKNALEQAKTQDDPYRKPLFYLLGLLPETRANIERLYDFDGAFFYPESLAEGWQTGTSLQVCRLAFNLYNGYTEEREAYFTPYNLFDNSYQTYMFEAIKLRYAEYVNELGDENNVRR